jgi:very-short-patch-repair endonuclease
MRNKRLPYRRELKFLARKLRKKSTLSEVLLWMEIKDRRINGYQFHRQVPVLDYIMDFFCHELMLAIEIDGNSHEDPLVAENDIVRQTRIEALGITFLRFDDINVKREISVVVDTIIDYAERHGK